MQGVAAVWVLLAAPVLSLGTAPALALGTTPGVSLAAAKSVSPSAAGAVAFTADELATRNVDAKGGLEKLHAIHSLRLSGKLLVNGGSVELEFVTLVKAPGSVRYEAQLQGLTQVQAFDGHQAWQINPFQGRKDPEKLSADDAKSMGEDAVDFTGVLVDYKRKGYALEYLGTEDVDGTEAHKIRVTRPNGNLTYVYLDPDYFLEIRTVSRRIEHGVPHETVTDYGDYEKVNGVYFSFAQESGPKGSSDRQKVQFDKAEANVDATDSQFQFPAAGAPASPLAASTATGPGTAAAIAPANASAAAAPAPATSTPGPQQQAPVSIDAGAISGLGARNIGSAAMSGRISALAGSTDATGKVTLFVGAASGGVWKSTDGGTTFKPVFDEQPVQSIGAIAVDPSNSNNVWVGTGESWTRNSVSIGNGVYKSTDGGETWTHVGLPESERVSKIIVDPRSADTVYACVPGKLWSDSADRGLYKTTDGGKSWALVLKGSNLSTGCGSIAIQPGNPDVLFASLWDFRRKGWTFRSGGDGPEALSGSALYRSADGGRTWTELTPKTNKGMPAKPYGRIALAIAPSNAKTIYAFIESTDSALFVSHDGGASWEAGDKSQWMVWRPFYFANLIVDPRDEKRVFKTDGSMILSEDGGKSFSAIGGFVGMHGDVHDVFIDPANSQHVYAGDDGGLWISYDGANKWWKSDNLPISQFYHVSLDNADPYHVYGGLQDNSSWVGDSQYPGGITNSRWENLYGGDGFWMFPDPSDPDYVYSEYQGGSIARINMHTHELRDIQPKLGAEDLKRYTKLRFNWNTPIALSPHDSATIYIGAQFLFRSTDHGQTWKRISPDLTTNDPQKQKQELSGGVTVDNSAAEMHTTIYSISESPRQAGLIWVGTDDGNLQLTRDGGEHWTNLTGNVTGVPKSSWVSWVQASAFDPATAYVAFDRHTFGDMAPYVYATSDFGKTWTPLLGARDAKGVRGYAHVIKEDTVDPKLLFLGTELGLWVSVDAGAHWAQFKGGHIPAVAVRDLAVQPRDNDLVLATHGRGIWIVDDITPLRHLTPELVSQEASFVSARPVQQRIEASGGWANGAATFVGDNPPAGAVITYYQRTRHLFGKLKIEVLDPNGKAVDDLPASTRRGLNRVVWTMHLKPPHVPPAAQLANAGTQGPRVLPGTYTVRMEKNGKAYDTHLTIGLDPRVKWTPAERTAQFEAAMKVYELFNDESALFGRIAQLRQQVADVTSSRPPRDALLPRLSQFDGKLDALRKKIVATKEGGAITGEERLREHTDQLYGAITSWDGPPSQYQLDNTAALRAELTGIEGEFNRLTSAELPVLNKALQEKGARTLAVPPLTAFDDDEPAESGGAIASFTGRGDPDAAGQKVELPKNLHLWH